MTPETGALPAFSETEYRRRREDVRNAAVERGLDAIVATYALHAEWLTSTWGSQFWVAPVIVPASGEPAVLVRRFDEDRVRLESRIQRVATYFDHDDAIDAWAELLHDMGLGRARLGLELDNGDLTHRDVTELQARLPHLVVEDVSSVVPHLMAVKSDEEIAVMRIAARRTRLAVGAFKSGLQPGATEIAVRAAMEAAVLADGSEGLRGGVSFGAGTLIPHNSEGPRRIAAGDPAYIECSGYHLGYCATLCRSAVVGRNRAAERLYDVARAAVDAIEATLRPGTTGDAVDAAARGVVDRAGLGPAFRHRTGYSVGLRANGRLNLSLKPGATEPIEAGMAFHTPIILIQPGVGGMACSETFLVTASGVECLVGLGRELIRV
ncbi:MAG TPA: Xaa-Pro peptidase family protein [Candidatus Limnocylindria bacterium]|nr:Xaa-Pro peptidase family protein [Candidatus Limnocylindria bacterium]